MGKLIRCLLKELIGFPLSVLLAPLIYSFVYEAYSLLVSGVRLESIIWFVCGSLLYVLLYVPIFLSGDKPRRIIMFLEHLEHELGHCITGFIFLRGTRKLIANPIREREDEETSQVEFLDSGGPDFLICLAPYYFPVFTVPLLIAEPLAFFPFHEMIDFLIGFTLAFHFVGLVREFGLKQETDIAPYGLSFPFCITCLLNTILLVIAICVVSSNYSGILNYFESSIARTPESYQAALQTLTILMQQ